MRTPQHFAPARGSGCGDKSPLPRCVSRQPTHIAQCDRRQCQRLISYGEGHNATIGEARLEMDRQNRDQLLYNDDGWIFALPTLQGGT